MTSSTAGSDDTEQTKSDPPVRFSFSEIFQPNCVESIRGGTGKSSVISLLVRLLASTERIGREHAEGIIQKILDRERHCSTAFGKGLAFPHLRTPEVTHFVGAIGIALDGVNFGSADQSPTKLILLTLSPHDDRQQHSELLSRLVSLMKDKAIALQLSQQTQPADLHRYLCELDGRGLNDISG